MYFSVMQNFNCISQLLLYFLAHMRRANKNNFILAVLICISIGAVSALAVGDKGYVEFTARPDSLRIVAAGIAAPIVIDVQSFRVCCARLMICGPISRG